MPTEGADKISSTHTLLSADEPAAFVVRNPGATSPVILVCDHASRRFPTSLGLLGLDPVARRCHLAVDIGAGALTELLAESLGVTAILCQYSRLIVDCNRHLTDPDAFLEFGDGVVIPGNLNLSQADKDLRAREIFRPYHNAIDGQISRFRKMGIDPVFIAIHSFTPVMNGVSRPWEMGVLWDRDRATAEIFLHELRQVGYIVGDNEPYSGKVPQDYSIDHHAEPVGLPHIGLEIRHDLIHHSDGVNRIAGVLTKVIGSLPAQFQTAKITVPDLQ
jgi:predicted N-formylglutamate amidohydrolase